MLTVYFDKNVKPLFQEMNLKDVVLDKSFHTPSTLKIYPLDMPLINIVTTTPDKFLLKYYARGQYPFLDQCLGIGEAPRDKKFTFKDIMEKKPILTMKLGQQKSYMPFSIIDSTQIIKFLHLRKISVEDLDNTNDGSGLLLLEENGSVVARKVFGDDRPVLSCVDVSGTKVVECRPYMDGFDADSLEELNDPDITIKYLMYMNNSRIDDLASHYAVMPTAPLTVFVDGFSGNTFAKLADEDTFEPISVYRNLKIQMINDPTDISLSVGDGYIDIVNSPRAEAGRFNPDFDTRGRYNMDINRFEDEILHRSIFASFSLSLSILSVLSSAGIDYESLNAETDGVYISLDHNGDYVVEVVSGGKRPDLVCYTIRNMVPGIVNNETVVCRPYENEMSNPNKIVMNSFDDEDPPEDELEYKKYMEIEHATNIKFVKKAADDGDTHAMRKYAEMMIGDDEFDPEEFFEYIKRASEGGDVPAMRYLGLCYSKPIGTDPDLDKAIEWYEKVIEHKPEDGNILNELGHSYLENVNIEWIERMTKAVSYFQKAKDAGYEPAIFNDSLWSYVLDKAHDGEVSEDDDPFLYVLDKAASGDEDAQIAFSGSIERWNTVNVEEAREFLQDG